jgi:hypothetical protein
MDGKLRIRPNPSSTEQGVQAQQPGRMLLEINGRPVWVDSSKISGTGQNSTAKDAKQLASEIKRKLGIGNK